jgi:hypothetical protein
MLRVTFAADASQFVGTGEPTPEGDGAIVGAREDGKFTCPDL